MRFSVDLPWRGVSRRAFRRMIRAALVLGVLMLMAWPASGEELPFLKGADISFLDQVERLRGQYRVGGEPRDGVMLLKEHGLNLVRLRIWNDPPGGFNDLERTVAVARRVKEAGMAFLLDFHYSDSWADPGKQNKPAAWRHLDFEALCQAVYEYSREVVRTLAEAGAPPDMVQVGNEITQGLLWDDGRVGGAFDTDAQWARLARLLRAGIDGVHDGIGQGRRPRIMIHIDRGGDNQGARWFFDRLLAQGVPFDVIGLSFYPWWHGTLDDLKANLADLARRYGKELVVVETAYPWTLEEGDREPNIVRRPDQLHPGYPASPEGQARFLRDLAEIVRGVPGGLGKGVVYWEPGYISVPPFMASPWENLALFDFQGNSLPGLEALGR